jgi:archaellum component FlaC
MFYVWTKERRSNRLTAVKKSEMYARNRKAQKKCTQNFDLKIEELKENVAKFSRLYETVKSTFNLKAKENLARFTTVYENVKITFNLKNIKVINRNKTCR